VVECLPSKCYPEFKSQYYQKEKKKTLNTLHRTGEQVATARTSELMTEQAEPSAATQVLHQYAAGFDN
jgi:hypothetical protein